MGKFVFLYSGGQMAETPEAQKAAIRAAYATIGLTSPGP